MMMAVIWLLLPCIAGDEMAQLKADPEWLVVARKYVGTKEVSGGKHNPQILKWWAAIRAPFTDDETPWCAAFVGGVLAEAGYPSTRSAAARSYQNYGRPLTRPAYGCITVFWRIKPNGPFGHVGFCVGKDVKGNLMILGGNQRDEVSILPFSVDRVVCHVWPGTFPHISRYSLPIVTSSGNLSTNEA